MKYHSISFLLATFLGAGAGLGQTPAPSTAPAATPPSTNSGPQIEFAELKYDFGKVDSGELIKHEYVFTNTGSRLLEITAVRPGCGCTTAGEWDKRVEPGKTGKIPIQFNSGGYGGSVTKTVTVACNDPAHTNVLLQLTGTLWRPIDVAPAFVMFTPSPEVQTNEIRVVKIHSNLDGPLAITEVACTNSSFRAELKTLQEGKDFELQVSALPPFTTSSHWTPIILKTSTARMAEITVNCYLNVQPVIALLPSQISLPAGPLTNAPAYGVTIQNNGTNSLSLSEPAIDVEGAKVKLEEVQPGRTYKLTATFPAGFQSRVGQAMEASVKSNHPMYPVVKIPIVQMPTPGSFVPPASAGAAPATKVSSPAGPLVSTAPQAVPGK